MGEADSSGADALKAQLGEAQMQLSGMQQLQADMQAVQSVLAVRTQEAEALQAKMELLRPMTLVTHSEWVSKHALVLPISRLIKDSSKLACKSCFLAID